MEHLVISALFLGISVAGAALGFRLVWQAIRRDGQMLALDDDRTT